MIFVKLSFSAELKAAQQSASNTETCPSMLASLWPLTWIESATGEWGLTAEDLIGLNKQKNNFCV